MRYLFLIFSFSVFACTDFVVKGADGTLVNGRSLEFAQDFHSEIQINPRKMEVSSMAPDGSVGMRWVSKYGFLGVNLFGKSLSLDGMNEKGLSAGLLWMPTTEYQCAESGKKEKPLDFADLIAWILGNFAYAIGPVALVNVFGGFQPVFILLYGLILTKFFPRIIHEETSWITIKSKIAAIIGIFIGLYFLYI